MDELANKLLTQVLDEKQVYLDNARLKHGVPRHLSDSGPVEQPVPAAAEKRQPGAMPATQQVPMPHPSLVPSSPPSGAGKSSWMKTAATLGLAAAAGAVGIPPIAGPIIGKLFSKPAETITQPEQAQTKEQPPEDWNDLVNWLREEKLK